MEHGRQIKKKARAVCELEGDSGKGSKGLTTSPAEMLAWPCGRRNIKLSYALGSVCNAYIHEHRGPLSRKRF